MNDELVGEYFRLDLSLMFIIFVRTILVIFLINDQKIMNERVRVIIQTAKL